MKRTLLLIICCVMVSGVMLADEVKKVAPVESSIQKVDEVKKEAPTVSNGIEVHGHWRIEILDKDGKSISVTEFDNALDNSLALSHMLGMASSTYGSYGGFRIRLYNTVAQPCGSQQCVIAANDTRCNLHPLDVNSTNMTTLLTETSADFYSITLSGSVVATQSTTIVFVFTSVKICEDTVLPSNCFNEDMNCIYETFTEAVLPEPPAVLAGQQILVTVEISFS